MRHRRVGRKLKRTKSHRRATIASLCNALILNKKIRTTVAKAKETRRIVEKIITRAKKAVASETGSNNKDVATRRDIFAFLRNRLSVSTLFKEIAPKVISRPGGYTRVMKLGRRFGDGAEMAVLELVDFAIGQEKGKEKSKKKTITKKKAKIEQEKKAEAETKAEKQNTQVDTSKDNVEKQ